MIACLVRWPIALLLALAFGARADELADHGVAPQAALRLESHHAATPLSVPGARTVHTAELRRLLRLAPPHRPVLIDVLGGDGHATLPGAVWLPDAGRGESFEDALQARLAQTLALLTEGDRSRPLAFFCASAFCWLSYNAALRAVRMGYGSVLWYRGGIEAWGASGGKLGAPGLTWQRPG